MDCWDEGPPLLLSREEKAILALLAIVSLVALAALGWSVMLLYDALPRRGQPLDLDRFAPAFGLFTGIFFSIVAGIFGRWPGSVTAKASMVHPASAGQVWHAFRLRDDYPGWKKIYKGITRLDEPGEVYRIDYAEDSECLGCLLPRDPDRSRWSTRVEVLEADFPYFYETAVFPKIVIGDPEADSPLQAEHYAMALQPIEGGGTRITNMSTAYRPKLWFAFVCWLGWPMKEELRSLKAHLDRTPDDTLYGIAAQRMANARAAKAHCGCA